MKKIKLLQVVPDLDVGGLQQVVLNLCRKIDKAKYDVSVLCLNKLGPLSAEVMESGIEVILLSRNNSTDYFPYLRLAKIFRRKKVQVVHTHNTQAFIDSVVASSLFTSVRRIIHTDHARNFPDKKRYMFAEWFCSHFVDKIVGVSEHTSKNLQIYEKIKLNKIETIPNGIDETIYELSVDKALLKEELGIAKNHRLIGLGVRLCEQKGITYLLKALPGILKVHPNITLLIAGEGPLRELLELEAQLLGISSNISFIGVRTDMPRILKMLDLYVLPSIWEGLPMAILEAMAAGCPIIATNVGGNATAIKHRTNGSLIHPKDPNALEQEIIYLLNNPKMLKQYIENSRKVLKKQFSSTIMTNRYETLYGK